MKKKNGFTLIELLVAISIIATLTAIVLPNFLGARERAKDSKKIQELNAIKNALRLYYNDNQKYPVGVNCSNCLSVLETSNYMPNVSNIGYTYNQTLTGDGFQMCVQLDAVAGDEVQKSQLNCQINNLVCGIGLTSNKALFTICAN